MTTKSQLLAYLPLISFYFALEKNITEKSANNIVPTHGFPPPSDPDDTIWMIY